MLDFDVEKLDRGESYRLLSSVVVPRPIAFVTTISTGGVVNAAPFSFFNLVGSEPLIVALGIARDDTRPLGLKDSARNILATGEFVVNIVGENIFEQMNIAAIDFPPEMSEIDAAELSLLDSVKIKAPRIAESPAQLECRLVTTIEVKRSRVVIGEVVHLHLGEEFYDAQTRHVLTEKMQIIGRMHGGGNYTRTNEIIELPRIAYKDWQQREAGEKD